MLVEVRCLGWGREGCALEADWEECMQAPLVARRASTGAKRAGSARKLLVGLRRATALCKYVDKIRPGRWSETSRCRKLSAHLNYSRDDPSQSQGPDKFVSDASPGTKVLWTASGRGSGYRRW